MTSDRSTCTACGKPIALVNVDKLNGRVGMGYGWVHITRAGYLRRRRHQATPGSISLGTR